MTMRLVSLFSDISSTFVLQMKLHLTGMFHANVSWRTSVFPGVRTVMSDILASITVSGGWVASGAATLELRSIIVCDSHLPPHCTDPLSDQWAGHCWIAFRREGLSEMHRDWQRERLKLVGVCFVLSWLWPRDDGGRIAIKLKTKLTAEWDIVVQRDLSALEASPFEMRKRKLSFS